MKTALLTLGLLLLQAPAASSQRLWLEVTGDTAAWSMDQLNDQMNPFGVVRGDGSDPWSGGRLVRPAEPIALGSRLAARTGARLVGGLSVGVGASRYVTYSQRVGIGEVELRARSVFGFVEASFFENSTLGATVSLSGGQFSSRGSLGSTPAFAESGPEWEVRLGVVRWVTDAVGVVMHVGYRRARVFGDFYQADVTYDLSDEVVTVIDELDWSGPLVGLSVRFREGASQESPNRSSR